MSSSFVLQKQLSGPMYYGMWNKGLDVDALLHPSVSNDGINWVSRASYVTYTPQASSGKCGDPTLMVYNNKMYVSMTPRVDFDVNPSNTLEIASSTDGDTWTYVSSPDFSATMIGGSYDEIWNDAWYIDPAGGLPYMFVDRAQTTNHTQEQVWLVQATNSALTTWGTPVQVTGTGFPTSYQSAFVEKLGSTYYLFYKNVVTGYTEVATNSTFGATGWTVTKTGDWAGFGTPREVQWIIPRGPGFRIYLDKNGTGYIYSDNIAGDLVGTWTTPQAISCDFGTPQHGSIVTNITGH